jgi:hypothetical protein
MATPPPTETSSLSLWDRLPLDLQRHIYGLATEQHCKKLMCTQVCPGIICAAVRRNQVQYQRATEQAAKEMKFGAAKALTELCQDLTALDGALADSIEALLHSIAGLPQGIWHLWMMRIRHAVPKGRLCCFLDSNALEGSQPHL